MVLKLIAVEWEFSLPRTFRRKGNYWNVCNWWFHFNPSKERMKNYEWMQNVINLRLPDWALLRAITPWCLAINCERSSWEVFCVLRIKRQLAGVDYGSVYAFIKGCRHVRLKWGPRLMNHAPHSTSVTPSIKSQCFIHRLTLFWFFALLIWTWNLIITAGAMLKGKVFI